jgi:apolipoprotein N-acyltransferase
VFPYIVAENPDALARIARLLPSGTMLISGAAREDHAAAADAEGNLPTFNSIIAINDVGEIIASYDKLRLVPFGEYVPFAGILGALGLAELVAYQSSFVPGVGTPRPFAPYDTPPVLPLICYEAIFSGDLGPGVDTARWMLNVTNDAWFAGSIGPAQHFQHARLRAVEQGLAMIRVANTGITASVDSMGRITAVVRSDEAGIVDTALSAPVNRTLFARYGSMPLGIILAVCFMWTAIGNWIERRERLTI